MDSEKHDLDNEASAGETFDANSFIPKDNGVKGCNAGLELLFTGYMHQDMYDEYDSMDDAIFDFVKNNQSQVGQALDKLRYLLDTLNYESIKNKSDYLRIHGSPCCPTTLTLREFFLYLESSLINALSKV